MGTEFAIKDVGSLHYFLGVKVRYFSGGIFLSQGKYIRDLLAQAKMLEATHMATPMAVKTTPHVDDTRPIDAIEYRRLMGTLVSAIFVKAHSTLQASVTLIGPDVRPLTVAPLMLYDNMSALHMTINLVFHKRTKHIAVDYHYVHEKVALGTLTTRFIPSSLQIVDVFTKPLSTDLFIPFRTKIGVHSIPPSILRGHDKVTCLEKESKDRGMRDPIDEVANPSNNISTPHVKGQHKFKKEIVIKRNKRPKLEELF
nr:uncharacterized protein LOC125424171 [Ziziphus jujuba var. spinosa]